LRHYKLTIWFEREDDATALPFSTSYPIDRILRWPTGNGHFLFGYRRIHFVNREQPEGLRIAGRLSELEKLKIECNGYTGDVMKAKAQL